MGGGGGGIHCSIRAVRPRRDGWSCIVPPHTLTHTHTADPPTIAGKEYIFELHENGSICFYTSFKLNFKIAYYAYNASNHSHIDAMVSVCSDTDIHVVDGAHCIPLSTALS